MVFVQSVQEANARAYSYYSAGMTAAHRDRLAVVSVAQWPEVQPLVIYAVGL